MSTSGEKRFDPDSELFQACVIAGLTFACDISDAETINRLGGTIAARWNCVRAEDRSTPVLAVLVVDCVYREVWMPMHAVAVDWGYHARVMRLATDLIPKIVASTSLSLRRP